VLTLNQFTVGALRITTTSNFFNGAIAAVVLDNAGWSATKSKSASCSIGARMWNERGIPLLALSEQCTGFDLTALPEVLQ
jgi:hypothetical protein